MLIYIIFFLMASQSLQKLVAVACIFHLCFANHAPVHILGLCKKWELGEDGTSIIYQKKTVQAGCLIRNVIKFFTLANRSYGQFSEFDVLSISLYLATSSVLLMAVTLFRKIRALGDLLAHTQVQLKEE